MKRIASESKISEAILLLGWTPSFQMKVLAYEKRNEENK